MNMLIQKEDYIKADEKKIQKKKTHILRMLEHNYRKIYPGVLSHLSVLQ